MSKSLREAFISTLESEIAELSAKLEAKKKERDELKEVSDAVFERIYQAGTEGNAAPSAKKKNTKKGKTGKGGGTTHMTEEQQAALQNGFLSILENGGGERASKDLKPEFLKLPDATPSRFQTVKGALIADKKIVQHGERAGATYKLRK
jgi:hypothetical protein